ncbi:acyltransferase domain-containing protein [Rubrobacter marinus]|uniref:[acyl-carrier-protein] S-malonyltransferase n=1 Tax=Rubrobacter marinus TaxID=2653852 RepID=A0A6G8PXN3_9ACTN|nr:ACP S-malonyltransferase [Rubrobacter marinus]QIN78950.1 acyltransferase domain-containing protein [Rubrobacter marinus]
MALRLAVVFPGQGTAGGEVSGEVGEVVRSVTGGGEVPYQLSVFASSVETLRELGERGVRPDVVAGHSLGEYAAAHAAGAITLEEAARLVAERDRLMNLASSQNPGGMVAVLGAAPREVADAVEAFPEAEGVVVAANFNTPRQTVISGEEAALDALGERLGGKKRKLEVAGAFHSPLMLTASLAMEEKLDAAEVRDPEVPMVSGVDGAILAKADDVRLALRDQMLSPVRWVAVVERLAALGVEEIVEAGGGTLVRMLRDFKDVEITGRAAKEVLS